MHGSPVIKNCLFTDNEALDGIGGAINAYNFHGSLINCTFADNIAATSGGAVYLGESNPTITNCIMWNNTPNGLDFVSSSPVITYTNVQDGYEGEGNLNLSPIFVTGPAGDYYLSHFSAGQSFDSPCLNMGSQPSGNICFNVAGSTKCLSELTTSPDETPDSGQVDMGFHYQTGLMPEPVPALSHIGIGFLLLLFSGLIGRKLKNKP